MALLPSWVAGANDPQTDFPLNNLPYGVFSMGGGEPRCGVAIGDMILDAKAAEAAGLTGTQGLCQDGVWNPLMAAGSTVWARFRQSVTDLLAHLTQRTLGTVLIRDDNGTVRAALARPSFADYLEEACGQVRRYGADEPDVVHSLLDLLADVGRQGAVSRRRREEI